MLQKICFGRGGEEPGVRPDSCVALFYPTLVEVICVFTFFPKHNHDNPKLAIHTIAQMARVWEKKK